jgi:hypothetical protein
VLIYTIFKILKHTIDFHETWYEHYACGGHSSAVPLSYARTISNNNKKTHEILALERSVNLGTNTTWIDHVKM